jgi:RNA polymerase sigma-70 factor (ECF subfamily)
MLLDRSSERHSHPPRIAPALAEVGAGRLQMGIDRVNRLTGKDDLAEGAGPDWVEQMLAVRDRQDRAAFAALFRHFAPRLKAFLMKGGMTAAAAEDCAQDVMATLWQKAHMFDPARASVATWVFAIARNRRIDLARRDRRPEPEDLPWGAEDEPDQADLYMAAEETRRLGDALALLPDAQRALIQRAFYGDLSHSEIAAETGLPLGTIKSRIRLSLERLRAKMNQA